MDCGRRLQRHISSERNMNLQASRVGTIMRYVDQLSTNLEEITGTKKAEIAAGLKKIIEARYPKAPGKEESEVE